MRTSIDTNVISAIWTREPRSRELSALLYRANNEGGLVICAPVFAELKAHPNSARDLLEEFVAKSNITIDFDIGEKIWRMAAEKFSAYAERRRQSGGTSPRRLLVDFLIGAHALIQADRLATLDQSHYVQAFPELRILS